MTPKIEAQAVGPGRVEVTMVLDAEAAQDFAIGFSGPKINGTEHEREILDAVDEAYEWEMAEIESKALREAKRRAGEALERERPPRFYRE